MRDGSLYIKSNISTLASGSGQLFLGVIAKAGLSNVTVDATNPDILNADKAGWIFVDPSITNLDTYLFAQGPVISYGTDDGILYTQTATTDTNLRNQLHVYGSVLSLNTIGGSRQNPVNSPYIVSNGDTADISQVFDLTFLRRFTLVPESQITGDVTQTNLVPYYPQSPNTAQKSGGLTGSGTACGTQLRCISDATYQASPLFIEYNTIWNISPSIFFNNVSIQ